MFCAWNRKSKFRQKPERIYDVIISFRWNKVYFYQKKSKFLKKKCTSPNHGHVPKQEISPLTTSNIVRYPLTRIPNSSSVLCPPPLSQKSRVRLLLHAEGQICDCGRERLNSNSRVAFDHQIVIIIIKSKKFKQKNLKKNKKKYKKIKKSQQKKHNL